jgi:uncharacterized surface protein with fasciclin (FAS1) repeats
MRTLWILTLSLFGASANILGQATFKTTDEAAFQVIKAEEQHKLASIEQLVEATRRYETVDEKKEYTILAPNNKAFKKLPAQTIDYLINPDNREILNDLISYHTIEGEFSEKQIKSLIEKGGGMAYFTSVAGFQISAYLDSQETIIIVDQNNRKMRMVGPYYVKGDITIHVIDGMILPHSAVY